MDLSLNLDRLTKEDALSVSAALLYSLKGVPQYSVTSELSYVLDYDNYLRLLKYFGGMTIRIPTIEEMSDLLKILLLYQYREVQKLPWETCLCKAGIDKDQSISARAKVSHLKKIIQSQEIGGREYE